VPCDEESGVGDGVWADADMALFDEAGCLGGGEKDDRERERRTDGRDGLCHFEVAHDDGEASATKGGDGETVDDVGKGGAGRAEADVVELGEEGGLVAGSCGVRGRKGGDAVCKGGEMAAEDVVAVVFVAVFEVVAADDGDFSAPAGKRPLLE